MPVTELQETIYELIRDVALLACGCVPKGGPPSPLNSPPRACLGCRARALLEDIVARGLRMRRWRQKAEPVVATVHVAGKWALYYNPGDQVAVIPSRHSVADLVVPASGGPAEVPCAERGAPGATVSGTDYSVRDGG